MVVKQVLSSSAFICAFNNIVSRHKYTSNANTSAIQEYVTNALGVFGRVLLLLWLLLLLLFCFDTWEFVLPLSRRLEAFLFLLGDFRCPFLCSPCSCTLPLFG
jgi:hypothetical protein